MSDRTKIAAEAKKIVFVPLGKLKKSPKNVRKVPHIKADIKALAGLGWQKALDQDAGLARGLNVHAGQITHAAVAKSLGLDYREMAA